MQPQTLAAVGRVAVASPSFVNETTLVWHAGEPCVLPADWYRAARAQIEVAAGRPLGRQAFQTNATLIDDAWIALFREPDVSVGVSLDGPAEIHDCRRKTRSGRGTHAATQRGIARLRDGGVRFHVIAVVTAASLDAPEAVAQALIESGAESIGLNTEEIDGVNATSTLFDTGGVERYSRFLDRFLDTVERADSPPRIREVDRFHDILAHRIDERGTCHQESVPGAIVSIGVDGQVSTFSPELLGIASERHGNFCFGNVHEMTDVSQMFLSKAFLRTHREIRAGVRACRASCAYFAICGGGSPANKLGELGRLDATETMHCRLTMKAAFEAMLTRAKVSRRLAS